MKCKPKRERRPSDMVVVYMIVDRKTREPVDVHLRRADARWYAGDFDNVAVIRCEVVKAPRKGGGA
jgi:hypothetical protein